MDDDDSCQLAIHMSEKTPHESLQSGSNFGPAAPKSGKTLGVAVGKKWNTTIGNKNERHGDDNGLLQDGDDGGLLHDRVGGDSDTATKVRQLLESRNYFLKEGCHPEHFLLERRDDTTAFKQRRRGWCEMACSYWVATTMRFCRERWGVTMEWKEVNIREMTQVIQLRD
ncbi:hypothetical protein DM860_009629 [Cuscuta australis]|uniref:Uncharacterized protein n=1 Tax=Cuscuta australis TaxID=267555 RepID=A0A328DIZ2_9ASTE|nr:hypothetical protein DM860_009629 [Cuscuta australis]